jgi:glycosyltransferase involved in cell wall biosynthesis
LVERTVVLFLSRIDPKKGLDLLLPAFARVRMRFPEAMLVLAGDGNPAFIAILKQESRRLCLDSGIVWAGFLRGEEKRAALSGAHIFVLPSYSENFGVAVVEAMGTGLPVIVSDQVGIHREIAGHSAGLVTTCSVDQIESALIKTLRDAELRATMGTNAARLARQFSPEIVVQQLCEVYDRVRNSSQPATA